MYSALVLAAAAVLPGVYINSGNSRPPETPSYSRFGPIRISGQAELQAEAQLQMVCATLTEPMRLDLVVHGAQARMDFDYDDFQEPSARTTGLALLDVRWTTAGGELSMTTA